METSQKAVGKLTIGKELNKISGFRLFHNHLTVDLVLALYDFGSPGFIELREELWFQIIRRVLSEKRPGLIFTFNPENTVPQRFIDQLLHEITNTYGYELCFVRVTSPEAIIESRMNSDSRQKGGKLTDKNFYVSLREAGTFQTPVIPAVPNELVIDSSVRTPSETAAAIAEHFLINH